MIVRGDVGDISCSQVESLNYFGGTKGIVSKAGEKVRLPGWARLWEILLSIGYVLASGGTRGDVKPGVGLQVTIGECPTVEV
jgi:hypothetical protein